MAVFFQMTYSGLNSINKRSLPDASQKLLLNIVYTYGQIPFTKEQLFSLLTIDRKIISRLLYNILLSGWLVNVEEHDALAIINNNSTNKPQDSLYDLIDKIDSDKHSIVLSDKQGLVVASSGFSKEQSLSFATQATELAQQYYADNSNQQKIETLFPVFNQIHHQDLIFECRLIQINGIFFVITTLEKTALNETAYFDLMTHLLRRYA
ncbi:MAG: hypothetical protein KAI02_06245 [Gammaproteobacteria bacterium]|nr:hypothetical protein [Gammaproteobacteria bacterium]